jgi:intein/homing endonuclease
MEKNSIYQTLNKLLNFDGTNFQSQQTIVDTPKREKIIIKGASPEEIKLKALELEQKRELQRKFFKTTERGHQKALQYEAARLQMYLDFESMEYYPLIASALDLYMEEATTIGLNGKMLNVYSNKDRIKYLLEELFYDIINVNVNLPFWTRNLCKYGNNFNLLYGERKKGISYVKQLVNYEIERIDKIVDGKPTVKFKDRTTGDEFNPFEIAHFRLLGDDRAIPYGSCLESNSYIKTIDGVKKIKDINKNDIVISFDLKTQNKIQSKVLDTIYSGKKECFKISTRHNFVDGSKEHKILIYDKTNEIFRYEFIENLKIGDYLIINNYDNNNSEKHIDKTEEYTIDRIKREYHYFNNINCIPDIVTVDFARFLGFMYGDGWISKNKDVIFALGIYDEQNHKYIDLLEKFSGVKPRLIKGNVLNNYKYSQAIVGSKMFATILKRLGFYGKFNTKKIPDWIFNSSYEIREAFLDGFVDADGSTYIDKWNCVRYQIEINNHDLIHGLKYLIQSLGYKSGKITHRNSRSSYIEGRKINSTGSYYFYFFKSKNKQTKTHEIKNRLTENFIIEPIISIETIGYKDVYDIHVDNENHNFYANNIVVHNSILNKVRRVFRQCLDGKTKIYTYNGLKHIEDINIGDDIYSFDYDTNNVINSKVKNVSNNGIRERFKVTTNDTNITLTNDHLLLTYDINNKSYSYKDIRSIDKDIDYLVSPVIDDVDIYQKIIDIEYQGNDVVWDIEVDNELHNFIAEGIVVHNCVMAEDAMLTNRLIRAGSKRVYKIDVGNMDDDDIDQYVMKVATKFKKSTQVNPFDGQIDHRFHIAGNDEDIFLPVRNANSQTGVDTLDGSNNMNEIQDIEFLRSNLLTGLGVPKPFLSFQDAGGGGKNLAQFDIRFAKKVSRIQQAMIQELNKISMIHLFLLGYSGDDLSDFTLSLTNPSTQEDLLKAQLVREQAGAYAELTRSESGIGGMSHTNAKKFIFNMSDREIVNDLKQQKMERVIMQEFQDTPIEIRKSGLFKDIDDKYAQPVQGMPTSGSTEQPNLPPVGGGGGMPSPEGGALPPVGGGNAPEAGSLPPTGGGEGGAEGGLPPLAENKKFYKKFTNEDEYNSYLEKLVYGSVKNQEYIENDRKKLLIKETDEKNLEMVSNAEKIMKEFDDILNSKDNDIIDESLDIDDFNIDDEQ